MKLKQAFLDTVPVMTGYLILGAGFGIILNEAGYGVLWSLGMSTFIYAGSCQYLLVVYCLKDVKPLEAQQPAEHWRGQFCAIC